MTSREPLTPDQIAEQLASLPGWSHENDKLVKRFKLTSYAAGLAFAAAVGVIADALDHHPDLFIGWKTVTVSFNTHDAGGKVTLKDVQAAQAVEALPVKLG